MTRPLPEVRFFLSLKFVWFGASSFFGAGNKIKIRTWPRRPCPGPVPNVSGREGGQGRAILRRRTEHRTTCRSLRGEPSRSAGRAQKVLPPPTRSPWPSSVARFRKFRACFGHPTPGSWGPVGPGGRDLASRLLFPDRRNGRTERMGKGESHRSVQALFPRLNTVGSSEPRLSQVRRPFLNPARHQGLEEPVLRAPRALPSCGSIFLQSYFLLPGSFFSVSLSLFSIPKRTAF